MPVDWEVLRHFFCSFCFFMQLWCFRYRGELCVEICVVIMQ